MRKGYDGISGHFETREATRLIHQADCLARFPRGAFSIRAGRTDLETYEKRDPGGSSCPWVRFLEAPLRLLFREGLLSYLPGMLFAEGVDL